MKLEKWALIAEIISAICIVLSLIFVGLQVRQGAEATDNNTEAVRSQVRESLMNADLNLLMMAAEHPYLVSFGFNPDEHAEQEIGRARANFYIILRTRDHFWMQVDSGLLDATTYESYRNILLLMLANSDFYRREWVEQISHGWLRQRFVDDINAELRNLGIELPEHE
jgi:hypothetical protein